MIEHKHNIFRSKALQHYEHSQEKDILPDFVAPRVFVFLWILLGLLLIATFFAWLGQIPTYLSGSGVVLEQTDTQARSDEATVVVFLPANPSLKLRPGLPALVQIGSTGSQLIGKVAMVEPGVMSPSAARTRYALNGKLADLISQPSMVVAVRLGSTISAQVYAGSIVSAQVQVGTRRVLSLVPAFDQLFGG